MKLKDGHRKGTSLFQSPEGDSLFFYEAAKAANATQTIPWFQSPEGDSLFFYPSLTAPIGHKPQPTTTFTLVCTM